MTPKQHTQRAIVAWKLALGAGAVVRIATDATHIVIWHVPPPGSDGIPFLDRHLHGVSTLKLLTLRWRSLSDCVGAGRQTNEQGCAGLKWPSPLFLNDGIRANVINVHADPPRVSCPQPNPSNYINLSYCVSCRARQSILLPLKGAADSPRRRTNNRACTAPQARASHPHLLIDPLNLAIAVWLFVHADYRSLSTHSSFQHASHYSPCLLPTPPFPFHPATGGG